MYAGDMPGHPSGVPCREAPPLVIRAGATPHRLTGVALKCQAAKGSSRRSGSTSLTPDTRSTEAHTHTHTRKTNKSPTPPIPQTHQEPHL